MSFPFPPVDLSSVPAWLQSAAFLGPLVLLFLNWDRVAGWTLAAKAAAVFVAVQVIGLGAQVVGPSLTPELLEKLQPFWAQFLVGLYVVLAAFGIQVAYPKIKYFIASYLEGRRLMQIATIARLLNREPDETYLKNFIAARKG